MRHTILLVVLFDVLFAGCGQEYEVGGPAEVDPADVTECAFLPVSGTQFQRYECNPVFSSTGEPWVTSGVVGVGFHAEEVLGHPFYQMWYTTSRTDGIYGLGYAMSSSGTDWTPAPANPVFANPQRGWNRDLMVGLSVVWDGDTNQYVLTYQGGNRDDSFLGLGILTSADGQSWTEENGGDPVIDLSTPIGGVDFCWPLGLTWESGVGLRGFLTGGPTESSVCQIYSYGGPNLATMQPDPGVVLAAGPNPYDIEGFTSAAIVKLNGNYHMFYTGIAEWREQSPFVVPYNTQLGIATSADGVNWVKSPQNPIEQIALTGVPAQLGDVAAQVIGPRIHLWVSDYYEDLGEHAIGYFLYEPDQPYHP